MNKAKFCIFFEYVHVFKHINVWDPCITINEQSFEIVDAYGSSYYKMIE